MRCILILVKKNYCWIWIAVDRYGKRFIDCVLGSRGTITGEKLWDNVKDIAEGLAMTDYWKPYEKFTESLFKDKNIFI